MGGLIISLIGVMIIVGQPIINKGIDEQLLGNLFFVLAMLGAVGHTLVSKEILPKYHPVTITFWSFLIGSLTFLPFFIDELVKFDPL